MSNQKPTLNQSDLKLISVVVEDVIEEKTRKIVKEELGNYPTKDEFYTKMDEMLGEQKTIREELAILTQHDIDHEDRIEKQEKSHPKYQAS